MTGTHAAAVVSTEGFALHDVSTCLDRITWETEDTACTTLGTMLVWFAGSDTETADTALDADPSVASHTLVTDGAERCLYRLEWAESAGITTLLDVLRNREGMIQSAAGTAGKWTLDFLFPSRDALADVYETCTASDMQIEITELHDLNGDQGTQTSLTQPQYTALHAAYEHGYFDIPREINLKELAEKLEISHQALSERLRRAQHDLLDQTIRTVGTSDEDQPEQEETTGPGISAN